MSRYCSYADLTARVDEGVLLQQQGEETAPTDGYGAFAQSIEDASAEIDGYLARRFAVPLVGEPPALVRKLAADIAVYNVFSRKGFALAKEAEDAIVAKRYDDAIAYLRMVAEGKAEIPDLLPVGREGRRFVVVGLSRG